MNGEFPPSFWGRLFGRLAASALAHPWRWLGGGLLLAAASLGVAAARLELKTSNLDLVDHRIPTVARFLAFAETFGSPNMLVVVLEGRDEARLREAVDRLAPRLGAAPGVRTVMARLPYDRRRLADLGVPAYFTSRDGGLSFVFVQPSDATSSAATIQPFVEGVRGVLAAADLSRLGVRAGLTGLPQYALDDRDVIQRDVSRLSTISFVLVGLICAVGFHAFRRPLLAMVALLFVTAYVAGFAALVPGHLTLLSAFFFSALFGLGSDYAVYVLHGMEERLAAGEDLAQALSGSIAFIAPGLATAALTTAAAFLTLMLSGFRGFSELGFIGAAGILLSLVATVTLLPALLAVSRDRHRGERELHRRGVGRALLALQHPALAAVLGAATLVACLGGVPPFDGDYTHLQPRRSESVRLEREMVERSGFSPQFAAFVAPDRDRAADVIVALGEEKTVGAVRSHHDLRQLDMAGLPEKDARAAFERLFRAPDGSQAIYAYPLGNIWDPAFADEFLARMRAIDPDVTGMPVLGRFMIDLSRHALVVTGVASGIVMLLIVAFEFRLTRYTLLASAPTIVGVAATLGAMRWLGLPFNPINVMAFPVIVGTGVDAGVHLTQRFLAEKGDLARTMTGAGHTVFISGLTTIVGFAALAFTEHRGLASFAIVLTLGSTICLALSLLVLPLVLRRAYRSRERLTRCGGGAPPHPGHAQRGD